ncbi:hypothetical protein HW555_005402 [Spodoptera exigua]|uniref:Endoplasmic reticulum vesicle transporter C-terminal domain-containing protein n=1 Tax=Spodoptera exigua TaxID=7107 RepID=A0A835GJU3_SPOEX|nr:hypothetical protein HW555_005402 [Spodoptera exigua]
MLRYRGKKKVIDRVKELDAFPKVPEDEVTYYLDSNLVFKFVPDVDMDEKLRINIDMTVAMPCSNIGADILDSTSQSVFGFEVVPTDVDTTFETIKTFQYSVKELERPISHSKGSHGVPGVFFKYDMAALKVKVYQERENVLQFTLRLFSIIGGIYIVVGFLNTIVLTVKTALLHKAAPMAVAQKQMYNTKMHGQKNPLLVTPDLSVPVELVKP